MALRRSVAAVAWSLVLLTTTAISGVAAHFESALRTTTPENVLSSSGGGSGGGLIYRTWDDATYCESWRFTVETNDAGKWSTIPSRCLGYVEAYLTGGRYASDSEFVAADSVMFANNVNVSGDGRDAWVFDIDETLLSNLPYYAVHGYGSESFDETAFNEWIDLAEAPALPASLALYNELGKLGFKIFLLTGRSEASRTATERNLLNAGYRNWERLILRGIEDEGAPAIVYKSEKRKELEDEGYKLHGSSGDQWSDLLGYAIAQRSFKLPNPMIQSKPTHVGFTMRRSRREKKSKKD